MKFRLLLFLAFLAGFSLSHASAEEPFLELIAAMRDKYYSDYALMYIDELRKREDVPEDVKARLSYEEYRVYQTKAKVERTQSAKDADLEKALAALERFVEASPDHALAAEANSERAGLFLDKAKALIWASRSEKDVRVKADQQKQAREWIAKARPVYEKAREQFEKNLQKWKGTFIDKGSNPEEYAAREEADQKHIQAQINLALCTYQEARTYDEGSEQHNEILKKAAEEFEAIHSAQRDRVGGQYARLYQGKCFEEMGEYGRALGLYDEILSHNAESEFLKGLQARTFYFKLIVLNKGRNDHKLVISEATNWLTEHRDKANSSDGLGIQMERAYAAEALAGSADLSQEEKNGYVKRAYNDAAQIALYAGEFRDPATGMMQRLEPLLDGKGGDPKDFGIAFSMAKNMVRQHEKLREEFETATSPDEKKSARAAFDLHLQDTERLIRLGLSLADDKTKTTDIARMRYFLAYTLYQAGKYYDAAVVGDYIARTATKEEQQEGQDAAYLALGALSKIYYSKPEIARSEEREMMANAAELLASRWPSSKRAADAYFTLGDIYGIAGEPMKATEFFDKVPQTSDRYSEALLKSGQQYWVAYQTSYSKPEDERPPAGELEKLRTAADQRITQGLKLTEENTSKDGKPADIYYAAKVTLSEILISQGKESDALKLIKEGDHPILEAIAVDDENDRPPRGPRSRPFAIQVYQDLLRAYMGTQQTDEAIAAMSELETIAGAEDPATLTGIYIELGLNLKKEIDRLQAQNNSDRLGKILNAFDAFLGEIFKRKATLGRNVLLWIAESYSSLGEGVSGDPTAAANYFGKAAEAYDEVLARAADDPNFMEARFLPGVKVRVAVLEKKQGHYDEALKQLTAILKTDPKMLDAQFEAADVYKQMADAGKPDYYLDAVMGSDRPDLKGSPIYGLNKIWTLLQQIIYSQQNPDPKIETMYYRALYELSDCYLKYAQSQSDPKARTKYLNYANGTVNAFALQSAGHAELETSKEFQAIYREIQLAKGVPPNEVVDLKWDRGIVEAGPKVVEAAVTTEAPVKKSGSSPPPPSPPGMSTWLVVLLVLAALGIAVGIFLLSMKKPKRRMHVPGREPDAVNLGSLGSGRPQTSTATSTRAASGRKRPTQKKSSAQQPPSGSAPSKKRPPKPST